MPTAIITSPIGTLSIQTDNNILLRIEFLKRKQNLIKAADAFTREVCLQLEQYFENPHFKFTVPYHASGTAFQQRVWQAMCNIPVGETRSYGGIAKQLNSAPRAVGGACGSNPLPIIIPCHRITAKNGIGGFSNTVAGKMISVKEWLLRHEK